MTPRCPYDVYPPRSFYHYPCGRPAKWLVTYNGRETTRVCGIHARVYRRRGGFVLEPLA